MSTVTDLPCKEVFFCEASCKIVPRLVFTRRKETATEFIDMSENYSTFAMQGSVVKFENDEFRNRNITDTERKLMLVNCAVNIPLALTSIIGNALVLHAVRKTPSLRSPSIMLLCGLALTDLAVSSIVQPLFIANTVIQLYDQSQTLIQLFRSGYSTVGFFLCGVSLCTVTAISLDRLLAIQKPLRYPSIVTTSRITRILIPIWAICLLLESTQWTLYGNTEFF